MHGGDDVEHGMRELLFAFERLGSARRHQLGLSMNEEAVLLFLAQGVTAPGQLSKAIGMTSAGMTNLLDRLEADGYLRRDQHSTDKRRVLLTLTKKGFRSRLGSEDANAELGELTDTYSSGEQVAIARFLHAGAAIVDRRAALLIGER